MKVLFVCGKNKLRSPTAESVFLGHPEIEALSKYENSKSLVRSNVSCGIFQDCDYNEERPKLYHQQKTEQAKS